MIPAVEPLCLVLEVAPNREPVEGSILFGPGEARAFTGWMELVAALESVIEGRDPRLEGRARLSAKED